MGERQTLVTEGGRSVVEYDIADHGHPVAEGAAVVADTDSGSGLDQAVAATFDQLPGWWLSSNDDPFVDALLAAGATMVRFAHSYRLDITDDHRVWPVDERITSIDRPLDELAELSVAAYGPAHPDFESADLAQVAQDLDALITSQILGQFDAESSGQMVIGDQLVALCLISIVPENPPWGGPWVGDVFRRPGVEFSGLGEVMLRRSIVKLAERSETKLGLAVSDGNPAEHLYRKLGFVRQSSSRKVAIPGNLEGYFQQE